MPLLQSASENRYSVFPGSKQHKWRRGMPDSPGIATQFSHHSAISLQFDDNRKNICAPWMNLLAQGYDWCIWARNTYLRFAQPAHILGALCHFTMLTRWTIARHVDTPIGMLDAWPPNAPFATRRFPSLRSLCSRRARYSGIAVAKP